MSENVQKNHLSVMVEGWDAYWANVDPLSNPYILTNDALSKDWKLGWRRAQLKHFDSFLKAERNSGAV